MADPLQAEADPVIAAGCAGGPGVTVTARVCAVLVVHALAAVTETEPPIAPGVTVMLLVVEVPDQPAGSVQL